eukprot:103597-Chlamydomonas_euryale.AAC.6
MQLDAHGLMHDTADHSVLPHTIYPTCAASSKARLTSHTQSCPTLSILTHATSRTTQPIIHAQSCPTPSILPHHTFRPGVWYVSLRVVPAWRVECIAGRVVRRACSMVVPAWRVECIAGHVVRRACSMCLRVWHLHAVGHESPGGGARMVRACHTQRVLYALQSVAPAWYGA